MGSERTLKPVLSAHRYLDVTIEFTNVRFDIINGGFNLFPLWQLLAVEPKRIAADITVMPLILESEYNEILGIVGNKFLPVGAGDPHQQAVLQYLMALDMKSKPLREVSGLGERFLGDLANPLGWVGGWASIYIDDSPLWNQLDALLKEDPDKAG